MFYSGKWLYSDRVVFFGKSDLFGLSGCIRAKVVAFGQSGFIREKIVVFRISCCNWENVIVFGQKWLYSGTDCCIRGKWL